MFVCEFKFNKSALSLIQQKINMNQRKAGVILSYANMGLNAVIQLIYVPMLLYYLTKDQYGIYQLMGSMVAYLGIMDFGLANTTTRYLSQAYATHDNKRIHQIISTSHTLYLGIAFVLLLLGGVFYQFITPIYHGSLSAADLITAKQIFLIMLLNVAVAIPSNIFTAVINANERFVFLRGFNLIRIILQPLVVWGILAWKASVLNLVFVQTAFNLGVITLNYLRAQFPFNLSEHKLMREMSGFSVFVFLHALMDQIYWRLGQLVLGAVAGAAAVANYAISIQLSIFVIFLSSGMSGVFLPKLSAITAQTKDMTEINTIFCKLGRLQFMLIALLILGFGFLGKTFLVLWIGEGYTVCFYVALILMSAYVLDVAQNVSISILQAMKKHAFRAYDYVSMALLNICLCIPLAKRYGEIGCAAATAICLLLGPGVALNWYYARVGLDLKRFFGNLGRVLGGVLLAIMCSALCFWQFPLQNSWTSLFLHGILLTGIYGVCMWFFACNIYEKNLILVPIKNIWMYIHNERS